jgi:hypothetical protein
MHMQQPGRSSSFMQVIDILSYDQEFPRPFCIKPSQGKMRSVRLNFLDPCSAHIVKAVH